MPPNNPLPQDHRAIGDAFSTMHKLDGFSCLPPSSLLHDSVPMSFVMSAGLIQVENELDRIVEQTGGQFSFTQPCFRHFDMKQVGDDPTRLSHFHMSAAFNIGSSKREAVLPRLWEFLTRELKLNKKNLWVTYLDDKGLGKDTASYECWKSLGVDERRLVPLDKHHCFWQQRSLGQITRDGKKCGPHTEIFYERPDIQCTSKCVSSKETSRNCIGHCRCGRFVEISNSLFIENYLDNDNQLINADTVFSECVIGLERLAMIIQGVPDVYQITYFQQWREVLEKLLPSQTKSKDIKTSINIILDHISAFVALINDGAPAPGHGGRKFIMKKLARGAMTRMLMHDLNIERCLNAMLKESKLQYARELLLQESILFQKTLERVKRSLQKERELASKLIIEPKDHEGMPAVLVKKHLQLCFTQAINQQYKSIRYINDRKGAQP